MMNTVLNSRAEALDRGDLFNLNDEALAVGLPLDLAITLPAHKHCLEGRDENARKELLKGVEMAAVVAFVAQTPPQRTIRIDYRSVLTQKTHGSTQQQTVRLTLRVHFTERGILCSATLGLMGEKLPY
ncbi:hypothetical protein GZZ45_17830 [Klebsiella aerogenes]|uniref:hypothetical protein n=1 Tax=Klebsiella aerogenes TaxID=548 RepID=UPI001903D7CB|nr:hypothetical protein [Klebsiella aerogenes]MBK0490047.1 hypothetical protein [Klebsiella aerogenes]